MIGNFCYAAKPDEDCVTVAMTWGSDGSRQGTLLVPSSLRSQIETESLPTTGEPLSIDGALAYGVVLAMRAELTLTLTGDVDVWREEWGQLIRRH